MHHPCKYEDMRISIRAFFTWLPLAVAIVGVCVLIYATVQQNYRQSLNDPQIQMAEDAAAALGQGASAEAIFQSTSNVVNINSSLAPWLAIILPDGTIYQSKVGTGSPLVVSTAFMGEENTSTGSVRHYFSIPTGVLQSATLSVGKDTAMPGEDRVTWQPSPGVRQAIVVVEITSGQYKGDFVVAGRSMREVEDREGSLGTVVWSSMFLLLAGTLIAIASTNAILRKWY